MGLFLLQESISFMLDVELGEIKEPNAGLGFLVASIDFILFVIIEVPNVDAF